MVYDGSIIQDNVALAQGYGIQDQCDIFIFPRGELPATFRNPDFHSLPASSSSVKAIDEQPRGVRETAYREATPDSRAAQPLFAEEEGKSSVGREVDPSGMLTLPKPLLAGDSDGAPPAAAMPVLEPVSPTKPTTGEAPVVATRVNAYQAPPKTSVNSQKLLPTAKAAPKAASNAARPDDPEQPTCKRKDCDHPPWNGKVGFYCSTACKDKGCASKICEAPGCVKARYEGTLYCSLDCMEKMKTKKATTGTSVPFGGLIMGPMFGAGQDVGGTPVQPELEPEKPCDMPPDPCELRKHPQLGVVSYQMMKVNYDHQVQAGAQDPYDPDALLIHWNSLSVFGQCPTEAPVARAAGAAGGAGGGGGQPPQYPVTAGIGYISPVDFVSPNYQNLMHYKPGGRGDNLPEAQVVVVEAVVEGTKEAQHLQKHLLARESTRSRI
jgi:hypothetical protein